MITEEEIKLLSVFIGPAIIAAVITGTFSLFLSRRSSRLEYITSERSKWREKIREIGEGIQCEDVGKLRSSLQLLKLYINAYGIPHNEKENLNLKAGHILQDTHIWALLFAIERNLDETSVLFQCEGVENKPSVAASDKNSKSATSGKQGRTRKTDNSEKLKEIRNVQRDSQIDKIKKLVGSPQKTLNDRCNLLISYLSLLLKFDWERAKDEVVKNTVIITGWTFVIVGMLGMYAVPFVLDKLSVVEAGIAFIMILITVFLLYFLEQWLQLKLRDEMIDGTRKMLKAELERRRISRRERRKTFVLYHNFIKLLIFGRVLIVCLCNYAWMYGYGHKIWLINVLQLLMIILMIIGTGMYAFGQMKPVRKEFYYVSETYRLKCEFYEGGKIR